MTETRPVSAFDLVGRRIVGRVVPYGVLSGLALSKFGLVREIAEPGSFDTCVADDSIYALWNHQREARLPLARNRVNLELTASAEGIDFELELPGTTEATDLGLLISSNILRARMSFGFIRPMARMVRVGNVEARSIQFAQMTEITITDRPTYPNTSAELRSAPTPDVWLSRKWSARKGLLNHYA